jgi:hypothetical protein
MEIKADDELVSALNKACLRFTTEGSDGVTGSDEWHDAQSALRSGWEQLIELRRTQGDGVVYATVGALEPGVQHLLAAQAVMELDVHGYNAKRDEEQKRLPWAYSLL